MPATHIIHKSVTPGQIYLQLVMQDTSEGEKRRVAGSMVASSSIPASLYAGPTPSELMTLINERAVSSLEHLGNRLHGESIEGDSAG